MGSFRAETTASLPLVTFRPLFRPNSGGNLSSLAETFFSLSSTNFHRSRGVYDLLRFPAGTPSLQPHSGAGKTRFGSFLELGFCIRSESRERFSTSEERMAGRSILLVIFNASSQIQPSQSSLMMRGPEMMQPQISQPPMPNLSAPSTTYPQVLVIRPGQMPTDYPGQGLVRCSEARLPRCHLS